LFAEQGYEGVSVRAIAKACNITLPLIYHYFPDKQAVYDAAVESAFSYMARRTLEALDSKLSGEERLREFLEKYVQLLASNAPEVRLIDRELIEGRPESIRKLSLDLFHIPNRGIAQILGEIEPDADLNMVTEYLSAMTYGIVKLRKLDAGLRGGKSVRSAQDTVDGLFAIALASLKYLDSPRRTTRAKRPRQRPATAVK
jgi:AcrR family transcriptional regulator